METKKTKIVSMKKQVKQFDFNCKSENCQRIMLKAQELFMNQGFSKVTMSELAVELGMSKKTVYKDFQSKDELLLSIFAQMRDDITSTFDSILNNASIGFPEKMIQIMSFISKKISTMRPRFMDDLKRNRPEIFNDLMKFRQNHIHHFMSELMEEGKSSGYIRKSIPTVVIVEAYEAVIQRLVHPDFIMNNQFKPEELYHSILQIFFMGVLEEDKKTEFDSITHMTNSKESIS